MKQDKRWQNTQDLTNTKHLGYINETYLGKILYTTTPLSPSILDKKGS